jgi:hypothetical protein
MIKPMKTVSGAEARRRLKALLDPVREESRHRGHARSGLRGDRPLDVGLIHDLDEPPLKPERVPKTAERSLEECVAQLAGYLQKQGVRPG